MSYSIAFSQALEITSYIAIKSEEQHYEYLSIQKISEKLNIPIPSIKKISSLLKKNGILTSKTGSSGGLRLAKDSKEITIYDILEAIEGTRQLFKIHTDFDTTAFQNRESVEKWLQESSKLLYEAEDAMENVLRGVTLDELDKR